MARYAAPASSSSFHLERSIGALNCHSIVGWVDRGATRSLAPSLLPKPKGNVVNAKTFSVNRIASRLLSHFLERRIVAEEPVMGSRVVDLLQERESVQAAEEKPRLSVLMPESLAIPQIGVL